ncbi:MAG TPA: phosphatidylglycerol lysyltransferase domain-containing protein [Candidatus Dormibacteraeota bacterium]
MLPSGHLPWTGADWTTANIAQTALTMVPIGSEAVVPVRGFSLSGKERAGLRYAVRHCERLGIRSTFLPASARGLPSALR